MKEKHPDCLMEVAEKFADVEIICGDATNQATTITTGVVTERVVCAMSIQDTSSLFTMAIKMYISNGTRKKTFTKNAIIAILVGVFKHTPKKNYNRGALLETLNTLVKESPGLLPAAAGTMAVATSDHVPSTPVRDPLPESPVEAAALTPAPSNSVQDPLPDSPTDTRYDTGNTHWLYLTCVEANVKMDCNLTPLQFSQHVLRKLRAVEDMDDFDETEWDEGEFFIFLQ